MTRNLTALEQWVLEQLADDDHHFADLGWLGGNERRDGDAMEVLSSLLARDLIEVRECYEGDHWSRLLPAEEAEAAIADARNWPRAAPTRTHWYEASATESGLVALWGPSDRPYKERRLP